MDQSLIAARSGYNAQAVADFEAEITGKPQRVPPIPENELSEKDREVVLRIRRAVGAPMDAPIPEYCLTIVKHPELLRCQLEMGTALFLGVLPYRDRELAVLRIAWLLRAPFEWGEHVGIGKRVGLTSEEIERVITGSTAPGWTPMEAAILKAVEEMLSEQRVSDATWAVLAQNWNEQQLIEFTMMAGQYVATALVQNTLRIRLEPQNPGLTHR